MESNLSWDDNFLLELLKNPFKELFRFNLQKEDDIQSLENRKFQKVETPSSSESQTVQDFEITEVLFKEELQIVEQFRRPVEIILRPHVGMAGDILSIIYRLRQNPHHNELIERYGSDLIEKLESIRRFYRIFIESSNENFLKNESEKLVRRFFGENYTENHINFIKLKRFFEKIKSFHEISKKLWNDIGKLTSSFYFMKETKVYFEGIQEGYLPKVGILIHQTDLFLNVLSSYLKISETHYNPINYTYTINLTYDSDINYTIEGLYNHLKKPILLTSKQTQQKREVIEDNQDIKTFTIVVDSQIRKFQKDFITVKIMGSKDWNRTKDYYFELSKTEYLYSLKKFYESIYIISDYSLYEQSFLNINLVNKKKEKEEYDQLFSEYIMILQQNFIDLYKDIINKYLPSISFPQIFIYHLGAKAFYEILLDRLKEKKIGEIIYFESNKSIREFPEGIIKKTLIDWWNQHSQSLDIELIDSYVIFMQQVEYLRYIFLQFLNKILNSHSEFRITEIEKKQFGSIKYYIYKRFFPNLIHQFSSLSI